MLISSYIENDRQIFSNFRTTEHKSWPTKKLRHQLTVNHLSYILRTFQCHQIMDSHPIHHQTRKVTNEKFSIWTFCSKEVQMKKFMSCLMLCFQCITIKVFSVKKYYHILLYKIKFLILTQRDNSINC